MRPTVVEVRPFQRDEEVCVAIEAALRMGSAGGWSAAYGMLELSSRRWTQVEIGQRFPTRKGPRAQQTISKYLFCAKKYSPESERPEFEEAWDEASSRDPMMTSETPEWGTPQDLFDVLDSEFHFTLDVCATDENAKCKHYFTRESDGLLQAWTGVCWMNPPYGDEIGSWVAKAHESAITGSTVVCLVPARVDTEWWWESCRYGEIRFIRGRLKFGGAKSGAPFPSAVVIFKLGKHGGFSGTVRWWEWR